MGKRCYKVTVYAFVTILLLTSVCFSSNPIVKNIYTADPAALVYDGTVYIYTGHDEAAPGVGDYVMHDWRCFSSTDMKTWTDRGIPLSVSDFSWAAGDAWASEVAYRDGIFYWYICAEHMYGGKAIGVATSESPTGPFGDAIGKALITNDMTKYTDISWDDIDPTVFIDDDGQSYLYWGNTVCMYAKLKDNMIELESQINRVSLPNYTEGPWLYKRDNIYYLVYAYGWDEQIAYATSNSPTGPWTYRGIIMEVTGTSNTNHPSIIDFNGQSYFIYHNGSLPGGDGYHRSVCIEKLYYNPDGTIQPVSQTSTGVGGIKTELQSYNFPNMYIRHIDYDARIDADVTPEMDSQWQLVPGLAEPDNGFVSIQSVNFPGYYLRHVDFDFVLEKDDGSSSFAADATFRQVEGLADSDYTSFQSYNFPERYIRHYDYLLVLEEATTSIAREDATFRVIGDMPVGVRGDIDGDGGINSSDYILFRQYLLGMADNIDNADLSGDGVINSVDYLLLRRYLLGIISEFPGPFNSYLTNG